MKVALKKSSLEASTKAAGLLEKFQNPDGSWGFWPESQGFIEPTVYALIALLASRPVSWKKGLAWLLQQQQGNGSFIHLDERSTWPTYLVYLLLCLSGEEESRSAKSALDYILKQRGADTGYYQGPLPKDLIGVGWAWYENSASWIEPTCYALLALKKKKVVDQRTEQRIRNGERFILSRSCREGGWNIGNPKLFGVDLPPYPTNTAFALLALQDRREHEAVGEAFFAYKELLQKTDLPSLLALGAIVLACYDEERKDVLARLVKRAKSTNWENFHIPTISLSGIAASLEKCNPFRLQQ